MADDSRNRLTIDWAALPSGFRERFFILLLSGALFTSYLASTVWVVAEQHWNEPGRPVIFTGDVTSLNFVPLGIFAFLATTLIIYLLHPINARRRFGKGHPLEPDTALGRLVLELNSRMNLSQVRFSITGDIGNQSAIALGFPGRRQVRFGGGMRLVVSKNVMKGRAVAAHELGHLCHSDVDLGHLSGGIAWATACLAGVTIAIQLAGLGFFLGAPKNAPLVANLWNSLWHGRVPITNALLFAHQWEELYGVSLGFLLANLAFFFFVIYLEYAAVLRSREHYADIYAGSLVGTDAVRALFVDRRKRRSAIWNIFRRHPSDRRRYQVIERPDLVLRPTTLQSLTSGYLAGIFITYVTTYTTDIRPGGNGWVYFPLPQCCNANELINALHNNLFLARLILFTLASLLTLVLFGSLNLRLVAFAGLARKTRAWLFAATVAMAVPFGAGLIFGEFVNPLALWRRLNEWPAFGGPVSFIIANPMVVVSLFLVVGFANQLVRPVRTNLDFDSFRSRLRRFTTLPVWVTFVYSLLLGIIQLAPLMKGPGPNWLETAIQNYQQRDAKIDAIFLDARQKVTEADHASPEAAVEMYTTALKDFDLILDHYPDSKSAAAVRGGNGNPINYGYVEEQLRNAECAARPARGCLMQLAHDEALSELKMGMQSGIPQFGLAAFGSIMAADRALGNIVSAQALANEVLTRLAPVPQHSVVFMTSASSLLQLANALAFVGEKDKGIETYQRIVGDAPPVSAMLLMRVLSATNSDLEPLRRDIEAQPVLPQFFFLVDLARQAHELGAEKETRELIEKALSIAPAGPQALYVMDVAIDKEHARAIWRRLSASFDLHSIPPPWLFVALRCQALLGDAGEALDFARAIPDGRLRARALFEIAVAQAQEGEEAAKLTLAQADGSAGQSLWPDPALALAAIEAHAWAGDASTAVLLSRKTQNQGYRALALARIACALSKLRHPFLFFANRPSL